ncbi:hypothetical protein AHiyo4_12470 [Arthrobacter sp. Hiyo4]|nr:hypothetical protein AHiyo4_12470 [Arthrobacter sp. Hiyo4]
MREQRLGGGNEEGEVGAVGRLGLRRPDAQEMNLGAGGSGDVGENVRRPVLRPSRSSSSRPGSKKGAWPRPSWSTLVASTSMPTTVWPMDASVAACTAPR